MTDRLNTKKLQRKRRNCPEINVGAPFFVQNFKQNYLLVYFVNSALIELVMQEQEKRHYFSAG